MLLKNKLSSIFQIIILLFLTNVIYSACPSLDAKSPITQNDFGNSSYYDDGLGQLFTRLYFRGVLSLKDPIFIAGGGYGSEAYELLKMGAQKIYINDLSINNLLCATKHLDNKFPKAKIKVIVGDITINESYHLHMKDKFGLITAKNVIQFLDGNQVDTFFNDSYSNLKKGGYLFLIFDNHFLNQQQTMISDIENNIGKNMKIVDAVKNGFDHNTIGPKKMHCSYDEFIKTEPSIRSSTTFLKYLDL